MSEYAVLQPIHLGSGEQGEVRRQALERIALREGFVWDGKPSIGRWLINLADREIGKMSTSSVKVRGSEWSEAELHDGWGDEATAEQTAELGRQVVERFHEIAKSNGSSAYWTPSTGEVIANRDEEIGPETLEEWRQAAVAAVREGFVG